MSDDPSERPTMAPPEHDAHWSCRRKTRYATEDRARSVVTLAWEQRGHVLRIYPCTLCGGFHLTRQITEEQLPKPGWRPPKLSQRAEASLRKHERRRFKR